MYKENRDNFLYDWREELFSIFHQDYTKIFDNNIVRHFFEDINHKVLLINYLTNPSDERRKDFETSFQKFFFKIRFTNYISSLIKYAILDYFRKNKKTEERMILIFDTPLGEEGGGTLGEFLLSLTTDTKKESIVHNPREFEEILENEELYNAFGCLTDRQKLVVTLFYSMYALDKEIAASLSVSQQAITKTRLTALKKIKLFMQANLKEEKETQARGAG